MNSLFGSVRYSPGSCGSAGYTLDDYDAGLLARRCWDDATCTADQLEAVRWAAETLAASDVLDRIDAWEALLEPFVMADPKAGTTVDDYHLQVECIRDWLAARPGVLARELPAGCLGEGGDLVVEGWGDLSTNGSCDRDWPDAVAWRVRALEGARVELGTSPDGVAAGDEVILAVLQGPRGDHHAVGAFAFASVEAVDETGLLLTSGPALESGLDATDWRIVIQRVPRYDTVTVRAGGTLTAGAWNGETGGILAFRVSGALTVESGGRVTVTGMGYAGGATGAIYNVDGWQGESLEGTGIGGATSGAGYNESNGAWAANLGGGGCNVAGGGGEHAGGASASVSWNGTATAPRAGGIQGDPSLLVLGSGGGGVVNLAGSSGPGGAGGGILYVEADSLVATGGDAVTASGADATSWAVGTWSYGAGGGAGGSARLLVETLVLGEGSLAALGGLGYAAVSRPGGNGGVGRIRVECHTVNGAPCSESAFEGLAVPAATVEPRVLR